MFTLERLIGRQMLERISVPEYGSPWNRSSGMINFLEYSDTLGQVKVGRQIYVIYSPNSCKLLLFYNLWGYTYLRNLYANSVSPPEQQTSGCLALRGRKN